MYWAEIPNCKILKSTGSIQNPGAALVEFMDYTDGGEPDVAWVPWSVIDEGSIDRDGTAGTLVVAKWFAEKELGFEFDE